MPDSTTSTARLLLALALILTLLAYLGTLGFAFVYDDVPQILENPVVHSWSNLPRLFTAPVVPLQRVGAGYWRPAFQLWLLANYSLFGNRAWGFHLTSLLLHLMVLWLVYRLGLRLTGDAVTAAMAALLWGLHPALVEAVAWISAVTEPLLATFVLGAFLCYLQAGRRRLRFYPLSLLFFAAALLAKETAAVLPLVLLAHDLLFPASESRLRALKSSAVRLVPFLVVLAAYLLARHSALHGAVSVRGNGLAPTLFTLPGVIAFYVGRMLVPFRGSPFYDRQLLDRPEVAGFLLPVLLLVTLVIAAVWAARSCPALRFALLWMALFLTPPALAIFAFSDVELVHDRYIYTPLIGLSWAVALFLRKLRSGRMALGLPLSQASAVLVCSLLFAAGVIRQNRKWSDNLTLYQAAVVAAPNHVRALDLLAGELLRRGRADEALALYHKALSIRPQFWETNYALGVTYWGLGEFEQAQVYLATAAKLEPNDSEQYFYLGLTEMGTKRWDLAEKFIRLSLSLEPARPKAHLALAEVLQKKGDIEGARRELEAELALSGDPVARQRLQELNSRPGSGR